MKNLLIMIAKKAKKEIDNYTEEYTGNYDNIENKEQEVTKEEIFESIARIEGLLEKLRKLIKNKF